MPYREHAGRHEFGQNFLIDRSVIGEMVELAARAEGPIVEIGAGDGALTLPLSGQGRKITAIEIDAKRAKRLSRQTPENVTVVCADILRFRFPRYPHVVVGNVPFHVTTSIIRTLLAADHWHMAVLLVQWEVARRRAGVGGASLLTASWWPWYDFELHARVPARAFRPVPSVDGGLLTIARRGTPLASDRKAYQEFVRQVFTSKGRGLGEILQRLRRISRPDLHEWMRENRVGPHLLPKDLSADEWASLWRLVGPARPGSGGQPSPRRPRKPAPSRRG
uniref:Dimethyladenosine transferase n=1 Tax=Salinispora mooreana TaxID=999545 RepID=A0A0F6Y570_9ACTN|nr:dimethyladenosine transferase [Salinispora mooreana]